MLLAAGAFPKPRVPLALPESIRASAPDQRCWLGFEAFQLAGFAGNPDLVRTAVVCGCSINLRTWHPAHHPHSLRLTPFHRLLCWLILTVHFNAESLDYWLA